MAGRVVQDEIAPPGGLFPRAGEVDPTRTSSPASNTPSAPRPAPTSRAGPHAGDRVRARQAGHGVSVRRGARSWSRAAVRVGLHGAAARRDAPRHVRRARRRLGHPPVVDPPAAGAVDRMPDHGRTDRHPRPRDAEAEELACPRASSTAPSPLGSSRTSPRSASTRARRTRRSWSTDGLVAQRRRRGWLTTSATIAATSVLRAGG